MMPLRDFLLVEDTSVARAYPQNQNRKLVSGFTIYLLAISGITFLVVAIAYLIFGMAGTSMYMFFSIFIILEVAAIILSLKPTIFSYLHRTSSIPDLTNQQLYRAGTSSESSLPPSTENLAVTRSKSAPDLLRLSKT